VGADCLVIKGHVLCRIVQRWVHDKGIFVGMDNDIGIRWFIEPHGKRLTATPAVFSKYAYGRYFSAPEYFSFEYSVGSFRDGDHVGPPSSM
jgi:hypothetical protein